MGGRAYVPLGPDVKWPIRNSQGAGREWTAYKSRTYRAVGSYHPPGLLNEPGRVARLHNPNPSHHMGHYAVCSRPSCSSTFSTPGVRTRGYTFGIHGLVSYKSAAATVAVVTRSSKAVCWDEFLPLRRCNKRRLGEENSKRAGKKSGTGRVARERSWKRDTRRRETQEACMAKSVVLSRWGRWDEGAVRGPGFEVTRLRSWTREIRVGWRSKEEKTGELGAVPGACFELWDDALVWWSQAANCWMLGAKGWYGSG